MKKPEKPKTDNLGWIKALLIPQKSKPAPKDPAWMPKAGTPSVQNAPQAAPVSHGAPPPKQVDQLQPAVGQPKPLVTPTVTSPGATTTGASAPYKPVQTPPAPAQPSAPKPAAAPVAKPAKPAIRSRIGPQMRLQLPKVEREKLPSAFFNIAGILSFVVNIILIIVLVILARELFALKALVGDHLLGGLYNNFILMDKAHIKTNIVVEDNIPIQFDLPISQQITVTLTENTIIRNAVVGVLSVPTTVTLPAGSRLPIQLDMTVPVSTTIPIKLNVPVDIPLEQTELHAPFVGLQEVVSPLYWLLRPKDKDIRTAADLDACKPISWFCNWFFYTP